MKKFVEWERFEKLEKKYTTLCQEQIKIKNKLENFDKMPSAVINCFTKEGLYIKRVKSGASIRTGIIYLKSTKIKKNHCDVCGKRRKTTAHHVIPLRLKTVNKELGQLRVRICRKCEDKMHPENGFDKEIILQKQRRKIDKLSNKIKINAEEIIFPFKNIIKSKIKLLEESIPRVVKDLKEKNPRKIGLAHKQIEGRIKELKWVLSNYGKLTNTKLGTKIK